MKDRFYSIRSILIKFGTAFGSLTIEVWRIEHSYILTIYDTMSSANNPALTLERSVNEKSYLLMFFGNFARNQALL